MPVSDIQIWADNLEDIRLPDIESDIQANTTEINNRVAELSYLIDVNAANTSSVYNTVTSADALATDTYNQFVNLEVALKSYADASAQAVRNDFQITLDGNNLAWQSNVETNLQTSYDATLLSNATQNVEDYAEIATLKTQIESYSASYATSLNQLLDIEVPALQLGVADAQADATIVLDAFNQFKVNYGYDTLIAGLDNIRSVNEEMLAPLGRSTLRGPATTWGKDIETGTGLVRNTLGIYGTFLTTDVDFGECYEFGDTSQTSIGSAYPVNFTPGSVYKITAKLKVISGTSKVAVGIVASKAGADLFTAELLFIPDPLSTTDGVVERSIYVSTDDAAMQAYGIPAADRIAITGSSTATKLYSYVQQNAGGLTTGKIRVGEIEVLDISEVLNSVQLSETRLSASITSNVSALQTNIDNTNTNLTNDINTSATNVTNNLTNDINTTAANLTTDIDNTAAALSGDITAVANNVTLNTGEINDILALGVTGEHAFGTMLTELNVNASGTIAGISNFGIAMADVYGHANASYTMRAKAGGALGEIEITAFDSVVGGPASKVTISADAMEFTGGLAMFGGTLKSANFDGAVDGSGIITSTGTQGWVITQQGNATFTNIISRTDLMVGSVTDGGTVTTSAAHTKTNGQQSTGNNLGAFVSDNFWTIAWAADFRHQASIASYYNNKGGEGYDYYVTTTELWAQYRIMTGGVWGAWITEALSPRSTSMTAYDIFNTTKTMIGDYQAVELRILYTLYANQAVGYAVGNIASQANTRSVSTIGKAITR